jgi:hypothetical protein
MGSVGFKIPIMYLTRWSSQYGMVKHSMEEMERDPDPNLQSKLNSCTTHGSLSTIQLLCLCELVVLLGPFKNATDTFQKDGETVGLVIPYVCFTCQCILDPKWNPDARLISSCKSGAEAFRTSLQKRLTFVLKYSIYVISKCQLTQCSASGYILHFHCLLTI